jgi:pyruvate formate-lyase activating enzyme-like uncharacterized protein
VVRESRRSVPLHYCSSRFKDGVQLKQRLRRRAERTAPSFATITREGTVRLGVIEIPRAVEFGPAAERLAEKLRLGRPAYRLDPGRRRVELAPARLRRGAARLRFPAFEVEEYPTADHLEVEREPLNEAAFPSGASRGGT